MLDHGIATVDASVFIQAAPLLGCTPESIARSGTKKDKEEEKKKD
jgi:hypothetical protein